MHLIKGAGTRTVIQRIKSDILIEDSLKILVPVEFTDPIQSLGIRKDVYHERLDQHAKRDDLTATIPRNKPIHNPR